MIKPNIFRFNARLKSLFLFLILIAVSFSCSVEKRLYTKGYNIQRKGNFKSQLAKNDRKSSTKNDVVKVQEDNIYLYESEKISASADEKLIDISKENQFTVLSALDKPCDNIILSNGEEISCVVEEVGEETIKYSKCENQSGPIYTISKSKIFIIKYSNGEKEVINGTEKKIEEKPSVEENNSVNEEVTNQSIEKQKIEKQKKAKGGKSRAKGTFIFAFLGILIFILFILSIIFSLNPPLVSIILLFIVGSFVSVLGIFSGIGTLRHLSKINNNNVGTKVFTIIGLVLALIAVIGILITFLLLLLL